MILATVHFRFAVGFAFCDDFRLPSTALLFPDLLRFPSTERPPASIILA
jgi:hypothetical protein